MELPGFHDFMASLDADELGARIDRRTPMQILQLQSSLNEQELALLQQIYQRAVRDSVDISLVYLQMYHDWLRECL